MKYFLQNRSDQLELGASHSLLADVVERLNAGSDEDDADAPRVRQAHLYAADCSTLTNTMKALVGGLVDGGQEGGVSFVLLCEACTLAHSISIKLETADRGVFSELRHKPTTCMARCSG